MDDFNLTALMEREDIFRITRSIDCFTGGPVFDVQLNSGRRATGNSVGIALEQVKLPTAYKVPA